MSSFMQIILLGNLGQDPELRFTQTGKAVANFSLAVSRRWGEGDNRQEETTWFKVSVWGNTAEAVNARLKKGDKVIVLADIIKADSYIAKDGTTRNTLDVTARQVVFTNSQGGGRPLPEDPGYDTRAVDDDIPF